jgi:hypothetical protein
MPSASVPPVDAGGAFSAVSVADTLASANLQTYGTFSSGGSTSCASTSSSSAGCFLYLYNDDPYGGEMVWGNATALSAFGALSGAAETQAGQNVFGYNPVGMQGGFSADFDDAVLVTGGTGTGYLFADFSWTAAATANFGKGFDIWPSFTVAVGSSSESWTSSATGPIGISCYSPFPCTGSGTVVVSTPFTFGGLTDISGSTADSLSTGEGVLFFGSTLISSASLGLTGFSVYDASGDLVPGAVVTPVLTPEPASASLLLYGALVLGVLLWRFNLQD